MERNLAENIRNARKSIGLTQEQLAEKLGITLGTISKWEREASEPEISYLMELADILRTSMDALTGGIRILGQGNLVESGSCL